ncbi:SsgA family sporulation/cell division regulator [Kitasatospora sp. NPDC048365]|uniref:SsgA family sporulation/cell division regulator n=1 Tax=Kitasatospora sp. NPDC048365 TaxID=3364050 RepID=UPI00371CF13F
MNVRRPDHWLDLELRAVTCPGLSIPVAARLRYYRADPYAVHLDCHVDLDEPITWVFAREILTEGLNTWAGTGDVSVFPAICAEREEILIALSVPGSTCALRAPAAQVRAFLQGTCTVVPYGSETDHLDLDALTAHLLGVRDGRSVPRRPRPLR